MSASVQVVVRLRPMNDKEQSEGTLPVVSSSTASKSVTVIKGKGSKQARSTFTFDNVFGSFSTQQEVFGATLRPVISDVLKGYETCVFAYGQTGTGKTHTMEGDLNDPDNYGVIPRAAQTIFDALESPQYTEAKVSCSYLEIYNEELSDLLVENQTKLEIMNAGKGGVTCRGLSQQEVSSADDVLRLMANAVQARRVGETRMNKQSSRSHCIFTLSVQTTQHYPDGNCMECQGKLHMVDLAGSESAKTAEMKDSSAREQAVREQERRNINKSLLTLGRVITALKEQGEGKKKIAPYRDSKLTRILQEALGGRCKTVVIATVSPSVMNLSESLQTLHYATKANGIQNKPVSRSFLSVSAITGTPTKGERAMPAERWQEMEIRMEHMQQEVEEARQALARNYLQQQDWEDRVEKAERAQQDLEQQVETKQHEIEALQENLDAERVAREATEEQLRQTIATLKKTSAILKVTQQTEASLTSEATTLLEALAASINDGDNLHDMVQASREEDVERRRLTRTFHKSMSAALDDVVSTLNTIGTREKENLEAIGGVMGKGRAQRIEAIEEAKAAVSSISNLVASTTQRVGELHSKTLIPQLEAMADKVTSETENTRAMVVDGDTTLAASCTDARQQLEFFAEKLREMDSQHSQLRNDWLEKVKKALVEARSKIQSMVDNSTTSIQTARKQFTETRAGLSDVLQAWQTNGFDVTTQIKQIATAQRTAINEEHSLFSSEIKRHDCVGRELSSQASYLNEKRQLQAGLFGNQVETLQNQSQQLEAAQNAQEELCKSVMETVMKGVQDLITEQMNLVTTRHAQTTTTLIKKNEDALSLNHTLCGESEGIFNEVSSTNNTLCDESNALHLAGKSVLVTLHEAQEAVDEINEVSENQRIAQEGFAGTAKKHMNTLSSVDAAVGSIGESLKSSGNDCVGYVNTTTQEVALKALTDVSEKGANAISFSRDEVIKKGLDSINKIEEPRAAALEQVLAKINSLEEASNDGVGQVRSAAKQQLNAVTSSSTDVASIAQGFVAASTGHLSKCEQLHSHAMSTITTHETKVEKEVLSGKEKITGAKGGVEGFGRDTIRMNVDVELAPKRVIIDYSKHLSSTPHEDDILRSVDVCSTPETIVGGPPATTAIGETTTAGDSTKENKFIDEKLTSSSLKSLPLRESRLNLQVKKVEETGKVALRKRVAGTSRNRVPKRTKRV